MVHATMHAIAKHHHTMFCITGWSIHGSLSIPLFGIIVMSNTLHVLFS